MWKVCWNKGRLCWKIAKLLYFCRLKELVRPETFGPYYVHIYINVSVVLLTGYQFSVCFATFAGLLRLPVFDSSVSSLFTSLSHFTPGLPLLFYRFCHQVDIRPLHLLSPIRDVCALRLEGYFTFLPESRLFYFRLSLLLDYLLWIRLTFCHADNLQISICVCVVQIVVWSVIDWFSDTTAGEISLHLRVKYWFCTYIHT